MLTMRIEELNELTVVECKGRLVQSESVFRLRDAVTAQTAPIIVLDLSEIKAVSGGAIGMLGYLDKWAHKHKVHLKVFNPSRAVREGLERNRAHPHLEIASFHELMGLLSHSESRYSMAA